MSWSENYVPVPSVTKGRGARKKGRGKGFAMFTNGASAVSGEWAFYFPFLGKFPRSHANPIPRAFPLETGGGPLLISEGKPIGTPRFLPRFHWALTMTSIKHTVTLIADFEAPLVDIQITFERDFHCGSINFQANFARTLQPTNDNFFCGITALLHFDFYEVKFLTSLRILKLGKKKANKYFERCLHCYNFFACKLGQSWDRW